MYKSDAVYNKLIKVHYWRSIFRSFTMALYKFTILVAFLFYNGLNIPLLNKISEPLRGNTKPFLSVDTLIFLLVMVLFYTVCLPVRAYIANKYLEKTIETYLAEGVLNFTDRERKKWNEYYTKLLDKASSNKIFNNIKYIVIRDFDYIKLLWTIIFLAYPVVYACESCIQEVSAIYYDESKKSIAYRAALGYKSSQNRLYLDTVLYSIINQVLPVMSILLLFKLGYGNTVIFGLDLMVWSTIIYLAINTITYSIGRFKHLSEWVVANPMKVDENKFAKKINWGKYFR